MDKVKIKSMDYVGHLKEAVNKGQLSLGVSKVGDWFAMLNFEHMQELSKMIERIKTSSKYDVDYVSMLVYLLCQLEGIDLFEKYKDDITESVHLFSIMVSLELLKRRGKVRLHNKLSFGEDCQIELLDHTLKHPYFGH